MDEVELEEVEDDVKQTPQAQPISNFLFMVMMLLMLLLMLLVLV